MPIHEYRCGCGHEVERLVKDDKSPTHCGREMQRLISRPGGFVFKGEGFYATEYGRQEYNLNPTELKARANRELKQRGMPAI